ncbi:MAG: UDP-N-acetylmuramate--L-alanine ligase [Planctomycetota bacterium]|jgi:UDP-N-acetylmuramate--alanine ligase
MNRLDLESNGGVLGAVAGGESQGAAISLAGKCFHFIGAGGVGMSGLAQLMMKHEAIITGSDQMPGEPITALRRTGADIKIGHEEENLDSRTDAVVISAAIKENNPELRLACKRGLAVYKYAEMLGMLMDRYEGIAVSGTHGKSTTSGWLVHCLRRAGAEPNFIIGALINQLGCSFGLGQSPYFVAEACEYDRSFLNLRPKIGCILNIEQDHLDYYRDEDEIIETFAEFARGTKDDGVLIANGQDANTARALGLLDDSNRCLTFGLGKNCNYYADNIALEGGVYGFDVYENGRILGRTRISLPGHHNVLNALAVVAMAVNAGFEPDTVLRSLGGFEGMDRRLMLKGEVGGITVLDDYAHHPTEIRASLAAIREKYQPERIWCVFQPHQYSRTRFLLDDFAESFKLADITMIPEIYFVRDSQAARREVNAEVLVERIRASGSEAQFIGEFSGICEHLKKKVCRGDMVVTMGAGDIWKVADEFFGWLRRDS